MYVGTVVRAGRILKSYVDPQLHFRFDFSQLSSCLDEAM